MEKYVFRSYFFFSAKGKDNAGNMFLVERSK